MRKYLVVLFIVVVFSSLALAAVPTMDAVGGSNTTGGGANSQGIQGGNTIYLRANTSDVEAGHNLSNVSHDGSTLGDIIVLYWSQIPNSGYSGYISTDQLTVNNFTNSSNNYCTFEITLPSTASIPFGTTHISFYLGLVQVNIPPPFTFTNDFGDLETSEIQVTSAPSNYYTYMTYTGVYIEISGGDYNSGTSFSPDTDNNAFFRIFLKNVNGSGQNPTVDKIEFDLIGGFDSGDVDAYKVWSSTDDSFSAVDDDLLVTITTITDPIIPDFSPDEGISSTGTYYFLTIDVNVNAEGTDTIGAEIDDASKVTASVDVKALNSFPISGSTHPLPVTLTSFTVEMQVRPVVLWETQSETNNAYWNIYRGISQNHGQAIWLNQSDIIEGQGTTTIPTQYTYVDQHPIEAGTTYWYWLECVDVEGEADFLGPYEFNSPEGNENNETPATPDDYGLKQNYPNPFNPTTEIKFALDETSYTELTIYNVKGEKVKTIFSDYVEADIVKTVSWNAKDSNNNDVASGVYFYKLNTSKQTYMKKMLLMK